MNDLSVKGHLF